jgi:multidrug efflux system outer membrane protein
VEFARSALAQYQQQYEQDVNAIKMMLSYVADESTLLPPVLSELKPNKSFREPIASEILLARPDIMRAESQLKAANADIGAARAAFLPRIALTTTYGTASDELSRLFKSGNDTWAFAPQIVMPIFDARTWSALRASKAQQKLLLAQYESAIQNAFKEVADLLAVKHHIGEQIDAYQEAVSALENTLRLANLRYEKGIDSYLSVLDAQRSLFEARQNLVSLRFVEAVNSIKLYFAMGGGIYE